MAAIFEWECMAHGEIPDGPVGKCPAGCSPRFVKKVFRTPPNYHNGKTAYTDRTLRELADSCGLTDMKTDKGDAEAGRSVMDNIRKKQDFQPFAVPVPHATPGWSQRGEKAPVLNPAASFGVGGDNIMERFKSSGVNLPGPTVEASKLAGKYTPDPNPKETRGY